MIQRQATVYPPVVLAELGPWSWGEAEDHL